VKARFGKNKSILYYDFHLCKTLFVGKNGLFVDFIGQAEARVVSLQYW
jgi:hypothetical protein